MIPPVSASMHPTLPPPTNEELIYDPAMLPKMPNKIENLPIASPHPLP
jgi:hypothetical protein